MLQLRCLPFTVKYKQNLIYCDIDEWDLREYVAVVLASGDKLSHV